MRRLSHFQFHLPGWPEPIGFLDPKRFLFASSFVTPTRVKPLSLPPASQSQPQRPPSAKISTVNRTETVSISLCSQSTQHSVNFQDLPLPVSRVAGVSRSLSLFNSSDLDGGTDSFVPLTVFSFKKIDLSSKVFLLQPVQVIASRSNLSNRSKYQWNSFSTFSKNSQRNNTSYMVKIKMKTNPGERFFRQGFICLLELFRIFLPHNEQIGCS